VFSVKHSVNPRLLFVVASSFARLIVVNRTVSSPTYAVVRWSSVSYVRSVLQVGTQFLMISETFIFLCRRSNTILRDVLLLSLLALSLTQRISAALQKLLHTHTLAALACYECSWLSSARVGPTHRTVS